jgi:hypothetical protein
MIAEVRHYLEFSDILAMEFECPKCHAIASHRIDNMENLPHVCQNCSGELVNGSGFLEAPARRFVTAVRELAKQQSVIMRLHVKSLP